MVHGTWFLACIVRTCGMKSLLQLMHIYGTESKAMTTRICRETNGQLWLWACDRLHVVAFSACSNCSNLTMLASSWDQRDPLNKEWLENGDQEVLLADFLKMKGLLNGKSLTMMNHDVTQYLSKSFPISKFIIKVVSKHWHISYIKFPRLSN